MILNRNFESRSFTVSNFQSCLFTFADQPHGNRPKKHYKDVLEELAMSTGQKGKRIKPPKPKVEYGTNPRTKKMGHRILNEKTNRYGHWKDGKPELQFFD